MISVPCTVSFTSVTVVLGGAATGELALCASPGTTAAAAKVRRKENRRRREIILRVVEIIEFINLVFVDRPAGIRLLWMAVILGL